MIMPSPQLVIKTEKNKMVAHIAKEMGYHFFINLNARIYYSIHNAKHSKINSKPSCSSPPIQGPLEILFSFLRE
jgi:hypothetical protein